MVKIYPGRYTAQMEEDFVVFIIGMRVNKRWAVHKWLPVFLAMNPMLQELTKNKELGFLDGSIHFSWRTVTLIQYWRSFDHLEAYARHGANHLKAWRNFNRRVGTSGDVGIFHETYLVAKDQYECVYANMPIYGLAKASKHIPAVGRKETASRRLGKDNEPAVPTPPNPS